MQTTRFEAPGSLEGALRVIAADPAAMILAGGTDLLVQYATGARRPSAFVDVKRIPELTAITASPAQVTIGAAVPAVEIAAHPVVREWFPGLVEAVSLIGSTQIQGRCSIGGNLCNASPAADSTCSLIVNRAVAVVAGPSGTRRLPVEAFTVGPGRTALAAGELLVSVEIPAPAPRTGDAYQRLIPRSEMDIAVASVAVSVTVDADGVCVAARVAVGAVAPTALVAEQAAAALVGTTVDAAALERAGAAAAAVCRPIDDKRGTASYRISVANVLTRRVAALAAARAGER
jgi:CO/xanthine dehydrogenase FAD-binding subunit